METAHAYKSATLEMFIDVITNDEGRVIVMHDRPFPENISWIEYDQESARVDFISNEGKTRFLGVETPRSMEEKFRSTQNAVLMEMSFETGGVSNTSIASFVFRKEIGF